MSDRPKRKASVDIKPVSLKKSKEHTDEAKTEKKEKKETSKKPKIDASLFTENGTTPRAEKKQEFMAICTVVANVNYSMLGGLLVAKTQTILTAVSDFSPYYHHAVNQAKDRMANNLYVKWCSDVLPASEWDMKWPSSKKIDVIFNLFKTGRTAVTAYAMTNVVREFADRNPIKELTVVSTTPDDSDPASKINPATATSTAISLADNAFDV